MGKQSAAKVAIQAAAKRSAAEKVTQPVAKGANQSGIYVSVIKAKLNQGVQQPKAKQKQGIQPPNIWRNCQKPAGTSTKRAVDGTPKSKDSWSAGSAGPLHSSGWELGNTATTVDTRPSGTTAPTGTRMDGTTSPTRRPGWSYRLDQTNILSEETLWRVFPKQVRHEVAAHFQLHPDEIATTAVNQRYEEYTRY